MGCAEDIFAVRLTMISTRGDVHALFLSSQVFPILVFFISRTWHFAHLLAV